MIKTNLILSISLAVALLVTGVPSFADQPASDSIWTRDKLTGDWGGLRKDLTDHGVSVDLRLSQFYQDVTSGGNNQDHAYGKKLDTFVNIDAQKLFGSWEGLYISMHVESRNGNDVLADAGGLVMPNAAMMYPLPGTYDDTQVTGFLVTQTLLDGKAAVLAGKLQSFDLLQGMFPHITDYGLDGFMNANSMMSMISWARWLTLSQYGLGAWTIEKGMPSTGFIVAGAENTTTTWSATDSFSDGAGLLMFHRFLFEIDDKDGYLYIGIGGSSKKYASTDPYDWSVLSGEGLESTEERHPWGAAAYWNQVVWKHASNKNRFVQFFVGGSIADDNPSFSDWDVFANVQGFGPFDSRPRDRMGVAAHYYHMGDDLVDLVNDAGQPMRDDFWTFETYYNIELNPWLHLSPNFQYAQNANKEDDPGVILGLRVVIDL
jgi:porin